MAMIKGDNDYEAIREKNIAERNAVFAKLFNDVKRESENEKKKRNVVHTTNINDNVENIPPNKKRRINRTRFIPLKKYNTRSKTRNSISYSSNESENDETLNEFKNKRHKLKLLFPWDRSQIDHIDLDEKEDDFDDDISDSDYSVVKRPYITKSEYDPNSIPSVDEITQEMLDNIAEKSTNKVYCKITGTSCHQCRQKTLDTKTVCRSGVCIGVRGQFCGPCLRGRYGENAHEALRDAKWACPPCRGLCNCSICRNKSGLRPTGILAPLAQEEGFSSVKDYLLSKEL